METLPRRTIRKILHDSINIDLIKKELNSNPNHTMNSLAKFVCSTFEFISPTGKLRTASCLVVLNSLAAHKKIIVPKLKKPRKNTFTTMVRLHAPVALPEIIPETVKEMREGINIVLIEQNDSDLRKVWNELIATEHPLGETRLAGYQVKYLIMYKEGYIGAASFSSAALNLECRDDWIRWDADEKDYYQSHVLNMSRFLIRNKVICKNLASHLLSRLLKHFKIDFYQRYGIHPWIVETFVDTQHYLGTCYKAGNWEYIGQTKGRGRNDTHNKKEKSIKDIYIYVLEKKFRSIANFSKPTDPYPPMEITTGLSASKWSEQEFGNIELGDERLSDRLVKIAYDKGENPTASYPQAVCGDRYAMKGYYGFLSNNNEEITFDQLLSQHRENTIKRIRSCDTVIAIQDTCDLNYSELRNTKELGQISRNKNALSGTLGLALHSIFTVDEKGLPLGIIAAECDAPSIEGPPAKNQNQTPIEEKETYKWLVYYREVLKAATYCSGTQIISAMDREADIFELYEIACANKNVPVVIRAKHNRILENTELKLFDLMKAAPNHFTTKVTIPAQRARRKSTKKPARPYVPARDATLIVSFGKVTIRPPKTVLLKNCTPLTMNFVYARELNPPEGSEKIEWKLLTTLDISGSKKALECIHFYKLRWRIEEFHRVLKSGCGVEKHKQNHADKLRRVIAIDMVIAWRLMLLTFLGRACPDMPAEIIFSKHELLVMNLLSKKKDGSNVITIKEGIAVVAALGGFRMTGSNKHPGCEVLWRGYQKLREQVFIIKLLLGQTKSKETAFM